MHTENPAEASVRVGSSQWAARVPAGCSALQTGPSDQDFEFAKLNDCFRAVTSRSNQQKISVATGSSRPQGVIRNTHLTQKETRRNPSP
jgi:hypothetical protein